MNNHTRIMGLSLTILLLISFATAEYVDDHEIDYNDYRYGTGKAYEKEYNITMPFDKAVTFDVKLVECTNITEVRYVNNSFILW